MNSKDVSILSSENPLTIPVLLEDLHKNSCQINLTTGGKIPIVDAVQLFKKYYSSSASRDVDEQEELCRR